MKITAVDVVRTRLPAHEPAFRWRNGLPGSDGPVDAAWLVISTDSGVAGLSFALRGNTLTDAIDRRLRSELLGQDPLAREYLWHRMWEVDRIERFASFIQGVVDVALWDLAGKAAGLPVYQLLGSFRETLPAYASTATFNSVEEYLDVADQCLALGYTAIKLHAWGDPRADAKLTAALRDHVGPDVPLMYDGSAGFDLIDAIYVGDALTDNGYLWYEEPMREFSVSAYKALGERVGVPLLVCEVAEGGHMASADFIASGCASAVRASTTLRGGFTGAMRTAHLADAYLLRAEVHGGGMTSRHLCMSISNTTYYESFIDSPTVMRPPDIDPAGNVSAPTSPGVGFEDDWKSSPPPQAVLDLTACS